jgi:diguanylate cyclase (GGDEF)-like protein
MRDRSQLSYRFGISALAVGLAGIAAAVASGPISVNPRWGQWPVLLGYFAVFVVCDVTRLELQIRRNGFSLNLAEIALVIGVFFIAPAPLLAVRALSMALVLAYQRLPVGKAAVNVVIGLTEAAVAVAVFDRLGNRDVSTVAAWGSAYAAIGIALFVSAVAVVCAISVADGLPSQAQVRRLAASTAVAGVLNITAGLIAVIVLRANGYSVVLLLLLAAVLVAGYRAYAEFLRQHKSLSELYEFTRSVGAARQEGALADALLTRTRQLLNAESATLWLPARGRYPEVRLTARMDAPGVIDEVVGDESVAADALRQAVLTEGQTLYAGPKAPPVREELRTALRARRIDDVIVVPLRSGTAVVGCLEVANRLGDLVSFSAADVRLLETLAAHAAVAVENNRLVDRLRHDAYHDGLTGLPNRRRFLAVLEETTAVEPAPGEVVAVLQFDVDNLRDVNDTLGYGAGDRLLAEVGRRLQGFAPDGALVARIGGDEFAVLVRANGPSEATAVAVALQYAMIDPFQLDTFTLDVAAAVGVAYFPDHGSAAETLLQHADVATEAAKGNPRGLHVYAPAMESRTVHRLGLVSELRRALDSKALTVHYQPKVALADNELLGVEALARWMHPEHGLVPPEDFIPLAEHTGLIIPLTIAVTRLALERAAIWSADGRDLQVSVNLSPRCLADVEFPSAIGELIAEVGLAPERLTLEITHSGALADHDRPLPALVGLHALGVRLSLDDFGSGSSSLASLRRLPIDEVKIDKAFVLGMATDSGDLAIVRSIVDLGRHLGHTVVAEGVETEMTLSLLQGMGCDAAQGFYFSRPMPAERFESWITARTEFEASTTGARRRLRVVGV